MSERARALEQARETALRTDATYLSSSGRRVRVQGHKLTGRVIFDSRGRAAVRNVDTDRLSYVHEADLRELAAEPPPSGASPQAETSDDMGDGWYVTVGRWGESLVTIEQRCLSGKADLTDDDAALIRGATKHLQAFIGQPAPVSPVEPTPEPPQDGGNPK